MNLEELKEHAKGAKRQRELQEVLDPSNPSNIQTEDILVVLHSDEVEVLEEILCDALVHWEDLLTNKQIRHVLNILKHLQEE